VHNLKVTESQSETESQSLIKNSNGVTLPAIPPPHHYLINFQNQVAEQDEQDE